MSIFFLNALPIRIVNAPTRSVEITHRSCLLRGNTELDFLHRDNFFFDLLPSRIVSISQSNINIFNKMNKVLQRKSPTHILIFITAYIIRRMETGLTCFSLRRTMIQGRVRDFRTRLYTIIG